MRRALGKVVVVAGVMIGLAALADYGNTTAVTSQRAAHAQGLSRAQQLKKTLRACKKDKRPKKRKTCRRKAARLYSRHRATGPSSEAGPGGTTGTGGATTGTGGATTGTGGGTTTDGGGRPAEPLPSGISVISLQLTQETVGEVEQARRHVSSWAITTPQSVAEVISLINSEAEVPPNMIFPCPPLSDGTRLVRVELQFRDSLEGEPVVTAEASKPSCTGAMSVAVGATATRRWGSDTLVVLLERLVSPQPAA